jgi:hypothetical protein
LDHDDVTRIIQKGKVLENKRETKKKMRQEVLEKSRRS